MTINNTSYVETLIFFYVIKSPEMANKFMPKYFNDDTLKYLFKVCKDFIMEFHEEPTENQVRLLIQRDGGQVADEVLHAIWAAKDQLNQYQEDWIKDTTKGFAEWNNFKTAVNRMNEYLVTSQSDVTIENCHDYIQKVRTMFQADANFTMNDSVGHDFFDPEEHKSSIVETRTTGYKYLDECLNGGWAKRTLNVIVGPPKAGKSMWLCNVAANSVVNGEDCAYITLEMSVQLVNQRIGANLMSIPIQEYEAYAKDENVIRERMKQIRSNNLFGKLGALVVEEFPTSSATVYDIEAFLLNAEKARSTEDKPFKFRHVFIDYINIMADARHGKSSDNTYMKIKSICEDVRAMAQRNDWCVISLTQTNRSGMNTSDYDMTSVAESSGLVATVDALFGIMSDSDMKLNGVYYLKALALRSSGLMDTRKKFNFSKDFMRITEDPDEPVLNDGQFTPTHSNGNSNNPFMGGGRKKAEQTTTPPSSVGTANTPVSMPQLGLAESMQEQMTLFS